MRGHLPQKSRRSMEERNTLIEANLGLVYKLFHVFAGRVRNEDFREDLLQEGMLGLLRAAELFDPSQGFQFSTYACFWIRCKMWDALRNNRLIKKGPLYTCTILDREDWQVFRKKHGHMPISEDILHDPRSSSFLQDIEARDLVEHALKGVHPQDRYVLLRWLLGHTTTDTAEKMGLSKQRIDQMKHRALARVKRHLEMAS